jgi:tRNA (adenine-N(1)-)-methyltransferase non-catalytic subunit
MKTQFSQEKYLKKKKNKHLSLFRVLQATAGNIADTLYINKPARGIKSDALFNILTLANIHYFSKVLVSDYTGGVILGSVLERTSLPVTSIYTDKVKDHALKYFGIAKKSTPQLEYRQIDSVTDFYDSMILAEKSGSLVAFQQMLSKLKGSGTFIMYSQDIVAAGETYDWIMSQGVAANVIFEEIWTREFQVLPQRTHPDMKLRTGTSGGYLVSGIKLQN